MKHDIVKNVIKRILTEVENSGAAFSIGDIVTDEWQEYVGRVASVRWNPQHEEFMYQLRSVPPYPWVKSLHIETPKSVPERHLRLFDKPSDFDENVRQETLHPMLRGWSKGGV